MSVFERVYRCVAEAFAEPLDQITAETRFADLDDSMDSIEMIMELEEEFDIELPDEEIIPVLERIETVGQLAEWIERRL